MLLLGLRHPWLLLATACASGGASPADAPSPQSPSPAAVSPATEPARAASDEPAAPAAPAVGPSPAAAPPTPSAPLPEAAAAAEPARPATCTAGSTVAVWTARDEQPPRVIHVGDGSSRPIAAAIRGCWRQVPSPGRRRLTLHLTRRADRVTASCVASTPLADLGLATCLAGAMAATGVEPGELTAVTFVEPPRD